MTLQEFIKLITRKKITVYKITGSFLLLAIIFTFVQPLRYGVTTRLLVVQNFNQSSDSYSISRSNQYLSNVLAQVVYTDSFFEYVMGSGYDISSSAFSNNSIEKRKQWVRMVNARAISDTGMIEINTYHQDKNLAEQVNRAIAYVLKTKNNEYHGLGDKVQIKIINNPAVSDWPVKPNAPFNLLFGLIMGLIMGFYYVYLFPEKEVKILFFLEKKRKINSTSGNLNLNQQNFIRDFTDAEDRKREKVNKGFIPQPEVFYASNSVAFSEIPEATEEDGDLDYLKGDINNVLNY